tara:strand:+ start:367 stop:675 length:309 start_codon:yes stop_codon:yes gene_type:complete
MNYDDWKLSNPIDDGRSGMVSSCCGGGYEEEVPTCAECGSFDIGEKSVGDEGFTICDDCGQIEGGYDYIDLCNDCDSPCTIIESYDYEQNQKDDYDEMRNED